MKKILPGLVLVPLLLAGCGSPAGGRTPASDRSPAAASATAATTDQFAAVISREAPIWRDYDSNLDGCNKAGEGVNPDDFAKATACTKNAQTVAATARAAEEELQALHTPPAEIKALVARTLKALDPVAKSKTDQTCQDLTSDPCYNSVDALDNAVPHLVNLLDDWDQYSQSR
ncbi:hypothetical protein KIH31_10615 [Paenarthrobacter sp. DKR-5]|uniref:hypothetical protein n=1 Tax=Paenarthrobacter sp. DKR-5 TaxID=2835535 RepID=UPI001BDD9DFC|nr:hypothetical protein [Paenarthrobacter sp. DKR-5]MBT1003059.1 hypothetical protein [Paenarthrobacter sp. DKR-5]